MRTFKDMLRSDIKNVFLNPDEFGVEASIDGLPVIIIDDESMPGVEMGGLGRTERTIYVSGDDWPANKKPGDAVSINGVDYIIMAIDPAEGLNEVRLLRARN